MPPIVVPKPVIDQPLACDSIADQAERRSRLLSLAGARYLDEC
jgi:hypothetical protein